MTASLLPPRIASLPKAELHLHLEGSIQPATVCELTGRYNILLTEDEVRRRYSYGDFAGTTSYARSDDPAAAPLAVSRAAAVPANKVQALFQNPFGNYEAAQTAPLKIEKAILGPVPQESHGWLVALFIYMFIAFYATGPGVCVWLALSELMPTRIRSNGMSIALVINQVVSTTLAATLSGNGA